MKIFITGYYHPKNKQFLDIYIKKNHTIVNNIIDANIILSGNMYIPIEKYPTQKFIFGPHFSIFPNEIVKKFNNKHNNAIYIQPSQPSIDTWQKEFNYNILPMKAIPFGVDTEKFKNEINIERKNIFVYFKNRKLEELDYVLCIIQKKGYNFMVFDYGKKYSEAIYLEYLRTCKFGIWIGRHESQGFALEEALSCNVPLLVWNVKLRMQEVGMEKYFENIISRVTSVPYWDERCGEFFYEQNEFESTFDKFINNIDTYKPREYIIENVSIDACTNKWNKLIYEL